MGLDLCVWPVGETSSWYSGWLAGWLTDFLALFGMAVFGFGHSEQSLLYLMLLVHSGLLDFAVSPGFCV